MRALEKILEEFVEACLKQEDSIKRGDSKTVNKQYRIIQGIRSDLKKNPHYGLEKLIPFLEHPSANVRLSVAFTLIPILPERAKEVLQALAAGRGTIAFNAEMTLSEWEKGNLKFDD
jgi:HEAT repeat protein